MKKLIFILFGLSLLSYSTVKSQEIATIGEIYDYEIGDEFHSFTDYDLFPTVFEKLIITRITDKIIHPDIDSITYYRHKSVVKYDLYNGDTTYQEIFDTIGYHHLDSLINLGSWYSVFIDPELYNGREINRGYWINQPPVQRNYNEYIVGCGGLILMFIIICKVDQLPITWFISKKVKKNGETLWWLAFWNHLLLYITFKLFPILLMIKS